MDRVAMIEVILRRVCKRMLIVVDSFVGRVFIL